MMSHSFYSKICFSVIETNLKFGIFGNNLHWYCNYFFYAFVENAYADLELLNTIDNQHLRDQLGLVSDWANNGTSRTDNERHSLMGYDLISVDVDDDGTNDLISINFEAWKYYVLDIDAPEKIADWNADWNPDTSAIDRTQYGKIQILFMDDDGNVTGLNTITMDDGTNGIGQHFSGAGCLSDPTRNLDGHWDSDHDGVVDSWGPGNNTAFTLPAGASSTVQDNILARDVQALEQLQYWGNHPINTSNHVLIVGAGNWDYGGDGLGFNEDQDYHDQITTGAVLVIEIDTSGDVVSCSAINSMTDYPGYENPVYGALPDFNEHGIGYAKDSYLGKPLTLSDVNDDGILDIIAGQDGHLNDNYYSNPELCFDEWGNYDFDTDGSGDNGDGIDDCGNISDLVILFMNSDLSVDSTALIRGADFGQSLDINYLQQLQSLDGKGKIAVASVMGGSNGDDAFKVMNINPDGSLESYNLLDEADVNIFDCEQGVQCDLNTDDEGNEGFGRDVLLVDDLNGDGVDDLLVGAYFTNTDVTPCSGEGTFYIIYKSVDDTIKGIQKVDAPYEQKCRSNDTNGSFAGDYFGHGITVWQLDGDGFPILAISATQYDGVFEDHPIDTAKDGDEDHQRNYPDFETGAIFLMNLVDVVPPTFEVVDMFNDTHSLDYTIYLTDADTYVNGTVTNIDDENDTFGGFSGDFITSTNFALNNTALNTGLSPYTIVYNVTDAFDNFRTITETVVVSNAPLVLPEFEVIDMNGVSYTGDFETSITEDISYELGDINLVNGTVASYTEKTLFDNEGKEIRFSDSFDLYSGEYFAVYNATNDDGSTVIVESITVESNIVVNLIKELVEFVEDLVNGGGGCDDCTPPTFGMNKAGALVVSGGFAFNSATPVDVSDYHTEFPLITVITNATNTATVKIYENQGVDNIAMVQFGLGMPEVGAHLHSAQTLVEISLDGTDIDEITLIDSNNLVDITSVETDAVKCSDNNSIPCLELTMNYVYRDQPRYNVMAINAIDLSRNSQTNYMNDGILVTGESLNDPLEQTTSVSNAGVFYPQRSGLVTLTLVDYKTDSWQDEYGYMWSTNEYGPYLISDIPVSVKQPDVYSNWSGYNDRLHSEFEDYKNSQIEKAMDAMSESYYNHENYTTKPEFVLQKTVSLQNNVDDQCDVRTNTERDHCVFANLLQYEIERATETLKHIERIKDPSYYYEHKLSDEIVTVEKDIDELLAEELKNNQMPEFKDNKFVNVSLKNNILVVEGNVGAGDKTKSASLMIQYPDSQKYYNIPVHGDGSFYITMLSELYLELEILHDGILLG